MSQSAWILTFAWLAALGACAALWRWLGVRQAVQERLFTDDTPTVSTNEDDQGWVTRWLFLAGYRSEHAATSFVGLTLLLGVCGVGLVALFYALGAVDVAVGLLLLVPGGVGEVFLPLVYLGAWMPVLLLTALPALVVRWSRQQRVTAFEQDLPLTLDLLATLAEAGLGFDAAMQQVIESQPQQRPLFQELRSFERDVLAGRRRVDSLRRLSRRIEVTWFGIFISAVIQAEQLGAGLAEVLRIQADDLRSRRRERALAFAMAVPVKLLVPLIVCFLPGIFVAAIGPAFYQIVQTLDALLAPYAGGG